MLQKAEVSSRVRKGIQRQTVSSNLSEPKNRHIARKPGAYASVRATTGSSSRETGCVEERPSCAALELTTEMQKPTLDTERRFQRRARCAQQKLGQTLHAFGKISSQICKKMARFLFGQCVFSSLAR